MAKGVYVGVNNVAKSVKSIYVGVNNVAKKVTKAYVGVNGIAQQVYSAGDDPSVEYAVKFSSDGNFILSSYARWDGTMQASTDGGNTWQTWNGSYLYGDANTPVYVRGIGNSVVKQLSFTGKYCDGNIENLLDYATVKNGSHPSMDAYCFDTFLKDCTTLVRPPQISMASVTTGCLRQAFYGCTELLTAPDLPATSLGKFCYEEMFRGCKKMTTAPYLPASSMLEKCYNLMFYNCQALKVATSGTSDKQILLCRSTSNSCVAQMFAYTGGTFTGTPSVGTTYYWYT